MERDHESGADHAAPVRSRRRPGDAADRDDHVGRDEDDGGYTQVGNQVQGRQPLMSK
jgi:hypothetical protein